MSKVLVAVFLLGSQAAAPVDFSGRWALAEQETSAFRGRGHVGNHEEPLTVVQTPYRLTVKLESTPPPLPIEYDLTGAALIVTGTAGESAESRSHWEQGTLVTRGWRVFTTRDGPRVFAFSERRQLAGPQRMIVELTISMFPRNLRRRSVYERQD